MTSMHGGDVVIARAAETDQVGKLPGHLMLALHAEAARNALANAGLTPADVDGLAVAEPEAIEVAHHLGVTPQWLGGTNMGGGSFLLHVRHAAAAIAADVVLITHGELGRSRIATARHAFATSSSPGQFEWPYGAVLPHTSFTVPAAVPARSRTWSPSPGRGGGRSARVGHAQPPHLAAGQGDRG
jgi:hypothetical protein